MNEREVPGHWEGDSVVGCGRTIGLHTEYERVTSVARFKRLKRVDSNETLKAMRKIFNPMPKKMKKSTTLDNGSEMTKHNKVGIKTYFADPYALYQRGGNEKANLWMSMQRILEYQVLVKQPLQRLSEGEDLPLRKELNTGKRLNTQG